MTKNVFFLQQASNRIGIKAPLSGNIMRKLASKTKGENLQEGDAEVGGYMGTQEALEEYYLIPKITIYA